MINRFLVNLNGCKWLPEWRLMDNPNWVDLLMLTSVWFLAALIVNPIGDFPLNDDWSFGIVVRRLIEEGTFSPTGWESMNLITQTLWGALFCKIFGFSFTVLRFSTLVISLLCLIGVYLLSKELNCPRRLRIVITLTMAFNPIYFALSYTFMTDIHFLTFSVWSMLFFVKALKYQSHFHHYIILGTLFSITAILCRQIGAFVPLAFATTLLIRNKSGLKASFFLVAPLIVIIFLTLYFFEYWLKATGRLPAQYNLQIKALVNLVLNDPYLSLMRIAISGFIMTSYFGLFLIPIYIGLHGGYVEIFEKLFSSQLENNKWTQMKVFRMPVWLWLKIVVLLLMVLIILRGFHFVGALMPTSGNIIVMSGIGPLTLHDTYILGLNHVGKYPGFWVIATLLSILGSVIFFWWIILIAISEVKSFFMSTRFRKSDNNSHVIAASYPIIGFLVFGAVIYFLPISIIGFFDRYLVIFFVIFPLIFIGFLRKEKVASLNSSTVKTMTTFSIVVLAFFSITTTHDYLSWNRARWMALDYLVKERGISPSQIDGGFEFNGFYLYKPDYQRVSGKSWWWVEDDRYMVTFGEIAGYNTIKRYDYYRWMPPTKHSIFLLERNGNE